MERFINGATRSAPTSKYPELATSCAGEVWGVRTLPGGADFQLPTGRRRATVGTDPTCDVALDDPFVSRLHCALERQAGGWRVLDLGSKNGTRVNGGRVDAAELRAGSVLEVGRVRLLVLGRPDREAKTALEMLVGEDAGFRAAIDLALRAGRSECSVLVLGETGTGKELVARVVHEGSPRRLAPFVPLNCGAIASELIGSELFGHVAGAFTGATGDRAGVFEHAGGGTLFLDEIGELPLTQQPHLLRVLESRRVRRIGDSGERPVDARIVAATHRHSRLAGRSAQMRPDLYHRLATVVVQLPPLRERRGDIRRLLEGFMAELAPLYGERRVTRSALRGLDAYHWPGNVRELRQAAHRAMATGPEVLEFEHFVPLPERGPLREPVVAAATDRPAGAEPDLASERRPGGRCDDVVRDLIIDALERYGSYRRAARALGMSKSTLADRVRRYGIQWPRPG